MGVFNKKSIAAMYGKGLHTAPADKRGLQRWMARQVNSSSTVDTLVDAAGIHFGFKPTSLLIEIAQKAILKKRTTSRGY